VGLARVVLLRRDGGVVACFIIVINDNSVVCVARDALGTDGARGEDVTCAGRCKRKGAVMRQKTTGPLISISISIAAH
jgi:hypothetical protein